MSPEEKKLSPTEQMSKRFIEEFLDAGQVVRNMYGNVADAEDPEEDEQCGEMDQEKMLKSLKRIKAL